MISLIIVASLIFWLLWINLNILHNRLQGSRGIRRIFIALLFYLLLPFGALVDVLYNKTIGTLLFLDWGCESTFSMRLTRYLSKRTCDKLGHKEYGYRTPVAAWIRTHLVEPWQPGHLGLEKYGYAPVKSLLAVFVKRFKRIIP
jgi:hypothetical protein